MEGGSQKDVEQFDYEEAVKAFRGYLREEQRLNEEGNVRGAREARKRAGETYETIARSLTRRFRGYAKGAFGDNLPHLVDEAQDEMNTILCSDLMDLGPKNELYERRFNLCVKHLMIDAVRRVRVQYDMPASGEIEVWDYIPESLTDPGEGSESEEAQPIQPVDDMAQAAFERALGDNVVRRLIERIPDQRQRSIFVLKVMEGLTWAEVAQVVGVSESTAKRHYEWVRATLEQIISEWE
jgi:RNA polymerase sigma factor (sigma-70 family)